MSHATAIVVGAGIIGMSTALALQARGFAVTVLDREGVAAGASFGNAGAFAFTDIVPLATPGIMRKAPAWLLDPLGPLSIPPAYALRILPWLLRFWRASWPDRYAASMAAQIRLMAHARAALERQIMDVDGEGLMLRQGQVQLYEGEAAFRASLSEWQVRKDHGIRFTLLHSHGEITERQPGIHPRFTHAGFTPDWINTVDPARWTRHLASRFVDRGGTIDRTAVTAVTGEELGVRLATGAGDRRANAVVIAAGAWSHHLALSLGDRLPLETERGYNTTLPAGAFDLRMQVTFSGHGFVVTKLNDGVRVGGAVELGGLTIAPNYERARVLLDKAARFLPGLETGGGIAWMGFRPSMPDSLPVIGASPRYDRVLYAFGHGHLGLTQAAGTAELIADLAAGTTPAIDLTPFAPHRFG